MWLPLRRYLWRWRVVLLAVPTVTGIVLGLRLTGSLQPLEWALLDQFFCWRPLEPVDSRIVVVEINEVDVRQAQQWPMSDAMLTKLLQQIKQQKPRAIGLDLYRDLPVEPGHQELLKLYASTPNLYGIVKVIGDAKRGQVKPPPVLKDQGQVAANDFVVDADGRLRRNLLSVGRDEEVMLSLGVSLALTYLEAEGVSLESIDAATQRLKLGRAFFQPLRANAGGYVNADVGGYQMLANFRNLRQGFRTVSLTDVLQGRIPPDLMRDRLVLIGLTAESTGDFFFTPYSSALFGRSWNRVPGVLVHADLASQVISAALEGRPLLKTWPDAWEWGWTLVGTVAGALAVWLTRPQYTVQATSGKRRLSLPWTGLTLGVLAMGLVGGGYLAFLGGWWIPTAPPLLGMAGSALVVTAYLARSAAEMRQMFGRYLADEVVTTLLEAPEGLKLGGERRRVTMLMSDLRGFSAISERLSPEAAVTLINAYLEVMTDVISQYGGIINEFMGDGIFVLFGAPISRVDDAERAVACAIAMQLAMDAINERNQQLELPRLEMGIGLHQGEVLAGNIGSQKRAKYTVIGSDVNLTSRIESCTVGGQILISKTLFQQLGSWLKMDDQLQVQFKGIQDPMTLYDISGISGPFNLSLVRDVADLVLLAHPIPIQYTIVKEKQMSDAMCLGSLQKVSNQKAELHLEQAVEPLNNLKITLLTDPASVTKLRDVYAKVTECLNPEKTRVQVRFTAVPPEVAALLSYLQQSGDR